LFFFFSISPSRQALATLSALDHATVAGAFRWSDGALIEAMRHGHWLLIDNVNFCNPAVLDRLNGLLEPGGMLVLGEKGVVNNAIEVIRPHPNFRLIFAMDPRRGEVSRAMRCDLCLSVCLVSQLV
jgi:midasin